MMVAHPNFGVCHSANLNSSNCFNIVPLSTSLWRIVVFCSGTLIVFVRRIDKHTAQGIKELSICYARLLAALEITSSLSVYCANRLCLGELFRSRAFSPQLSPCFCFFRLSSVHCGAFDGKKEGIDH